jgi:hypothetical protein
MNPTSAMGCHRALNHLDLNAAIAARIAAQNSRLLGSVRIAAKAAARRRLLALRDLRHMIGDDGYKLP